MAGILPNPSGVSVFTSFTTSFAMMRLSAAARYMLAAKVLKSDSDHTIKPEPVPDIFIDLNVPHQTVMLKEEIIEPSCL